MPHFVRSVVAAALLAAVPFTTSHLSAQSAPGKAAKAAKAAKATKASEKSVDKAAKAGSKEHMMDHAMDHAMDHDQMAMGDHMKTGWKELDAYHEYMEATWHPAKGRKDLKPLRAKANGMAAAAKLLAGSTPPRECNAPGLRTAAAGLSPATSDLAVMVARNASDAELTSALAALHTKFAVLEKGCSAEAKAKNAVKH